MAERGKNNKQQNTKQKEAKRRKFESIYDFGHRSLDQDIIEKLGALRSELLKEILEYEGEYLEEINGNSYKVTYKSKIPEDDSDWSGSFTDALMNFHNKNSIKFENMESISITNAQAKANDLEIKYEEVTSLDATSNIKKVKTKFCEYEAKSIIFAAGTINRQLDLENEEKFCGRGISYCAICDGNFYKDKTVCVIGGGDTAMEEAVYLGGICKKVYVIYRKDKFRAQNVLQNSLFNHIKNKGNIEIIYNAEVVKLLGEKSLSQIEIKINNDNTKLLDVDGMFLAIGKIPDTQILSGQIALDKDGYIIVDGNLQTNVKGVYAAGDCRQKLIRQILAACSDGAICATNANKFLKGE